MIGTLINGKYEIKSSLAESHMYDIFEALEIETGASVVVKILKPEMAIQPERVKIFSEEIKSFAALSHASVVHVLDVDMLKDRPYVVTEHAEGKDLRDWMREAPVSFADAGKVVQQLGMVLQYACEQGVSIRSLKLSNIIRTPKGGIKILSFSLPRLKLVGAPVPDEAVGIQSDLFFLGTTFFELLAGESPIRRRGGINECWDTILRQALRLRHAGLIPEMIELVVDFVEKTLTREVRKRFQSHESFLMNLSELIHLSGGVDAIEKTATKLRLATASEVVDAITGRMEAFSELAQSVVGGGPGTPGSPGSSRPQLVAVPRNQAAAVHQAAAVNQTATGKSGPHRVQMGTANLGKGHAAGAAQAVAAVATAAGSEVPTAFLRLIDGGRRAAESMIWRHSDDLPWYRNPLFLMGGGILLLVVLIIFW